MEFTGPGCRWLLARWAELRTRLETTGECWQSPEKLMAIRLLGRQPLDAADVRDVTEVFLACHVLDPQHKHAFFELRCELTEAEFKQYDKRLQGRNLDAMRPADATAARAMLLGLVDRAMDRLRPLAEVHRIREDRVAALRPDMAAFDDSTEGERLRRQAMACDRGLHRTLASILKVRKEGATAECDNLQPVDAAYAPAVAGADHFLQNEPTSGFDRAFQDETRGCFDQAFQDEPTDSFDQLSKTNPPATAQGKIPESNPPPITQPTVHKTNPRLTFEICGTNPPTTSRISKTNPPMSTRIAKTNPPTSSTISKTNPPSTIEISGKSAGIALWMTNRRAKGWSGFR